MAGTANNACSAVRDELVRMACDAAAASPLAAEHLAECAACREWLAAARTVASAAGAALAPEPLSEALSSRIAARLDGVVAARRRGPWVRRIGAAGLAAAAVLAGAVLMRAAQQADRGRMESPTVEPAQAVNTATEWDGSTQDSIAMLAARVDNVAEQMDSDVAASRSLPWAAEDDWDMPDTESGASGATAGPVRALVSRASRTVNEL